MKINSALLLLVSAIFAISGCTSLPIPGKSVDPYEGLSQEEHDQLKLREIDKIRMPNAELESYLQNVLMKLYKEDLIAKQNLRVAIVSSEAPGVAVLPGGLLIWNVGTFEFLESEDEVAAILAHEMTHLLAGHHETDHTGSIMDKFLAAGETAVFFSGAGSMAELWAASNTLRWASDSVLFPSFTREEETEADIEAARVLVNAGYNADAVRVVLGKLRDYYGDQVEFIADKMLSFSKDDTADGSRLNLTVDTEAVIGNLKGYAQNRWGQAYDSYTEREAAVRQVLITDFSERNRGQFMVSNYVEVLSSESVKKWLDVHKSGYEIATLDIHTDEDIRTFQSAVVRMLDDPSTSEVFDYDIIFKSALKNGIGNVAAGVALNMIKSDQATLEQYLLVGSYMRQQGDYEEAIAVFELADNIFPSDYDQTLVPLILATKDDAGMKQGSTALRCLDPRLTMACLNRK